MGNSSCKCIVISKTKLALLQPMITKVMTTNGVIVITIRLVFVVGAAMTLVLPCLLVEMQHLVEMLLELKEARVLVAQRHLMIITGATAKPLNPKPPKP